MKMMKSLWVLSGITSLQSFSEFPSSTSDTALDCVAAACCVGSNSLRREMWQHNKNICNLCCTCSGW